MEKLTNIDLHEEVLLAIYSRSDEITIFDIGACEGMSSIRYSKIFPSSRIYAFEPVPDNLKIIKSNKAKFDLQKFWFFDFALSNENGFMNFHISSGQPDNNKSDNVDHGNKSSSLFEPDEAKSVFPWLKFDKVIEVKTVRLDDFLIEQNIDIIDFVHMDVQGAELMVLQGAGTRIKNINLVWLEVEKVPLYKGQPLKSDIEKFLISNDFTCVIDLVDDVSGDQLWINNNVIKERPELKKYLSKIKFRTSFKSTRKSTLNRIKKFIRPRSRIKKLLGK